MSKDLLVCMAATKEAGFMPEYLAQLKSAGIDVQVDWLKGFTTENTLGFQVQRERRLAREFRDYRAIVFTDAFDVLFYGTKADVLAKIPRDRVLLAAERNCYPDITIAPLIAGTTPWRYANGGMLAGSPEAVLEWLDAVEAHDAYHAQFCNQSFFNVLRLTSPAMVPLDERTELFYCLYGDAGELTYDGGLPRNTLCDTRPNFIHANGHWPMRRPGATVEPPALARMSVDEVRLRGQVFSTDATPWEAHAVGDSRTPPVAAICIPFGFRNADGSLRWTPPEFSIALAMLQMPLNAQAMYLATKGQKRDEARCELVQQARAQRAKYVLFLDDDNPPPSDALLKLLYVMELSGDDVALCGGIYCAKSDPPSPLVFMAEGAGPYWKWRAGDVFECPGGIATGCMLIRASVFDHIPEPWFVDSPTRTDDLYFCRKVREAGYRMLAHGGVLPGHWGQDGREYRLPEDSYPFTGKVVAHGGQGSSAHDEAREPALSESV